MGAAATQAEVRHQVTPARLTSPSTQDSQLCRCGAIPWSVCHPGTEGRCPPSSPTPASDPRHEHGQDVLRPGHTSEPVWEGGGLGLGPWRLPGVCPDTAELLPSTWICSEAKPASEGCSLEVRLCTLGGEKRPGAGGAGRGEAWPQHTGPQVPPWREDV